MVALRVFVRVIHNIILHSDAGVRDRRGSTLYAEPELRWCANPAAANRLSYEIIPEAQGVCSKPRTAAGPKTRSVGTAGILAALSRDRRARHLPSDPLRVNPAPLHRLGGISVPPAARAARARSSYRHRCITCRTRRCVTATIRSGERSMMVMRRSSRGWRCVLEAGTASE